MHGSTRAPSSRRRSAVAARGALPDPLVRRAHRLAQHHAWTEPLADRAR